MRKLAAIIVGVIAISIGLCATYATRNVTGSGRILSTLNLQCIGCGPDAYSSNENEHAMAFALFASAGAILLNAELSRTAADWLTTNAHPSSEAVGWGLGFAWDAFSDGSENPAHTVYGITTALAVRGLLDAYETTHDSRYLDVAVDALSYYSQYFTKTPTGGYFWYSDQPADSFNVFNVSSMLMGQFARASALTGKKQFLELAEYAKNDLLHHANTLGNVDFWEYSDPPRDMPNDSVHAAYIVQGLLDYSKAVGTSVPKQNAINYLRTFIGDDNILEWSPIHEIDDSRADRPARLWGVGMLVYSLADAGELAVAQAGAHVLFDAYSTNEGFRSSPERVPASEPRMVAHALLGVAQLERALSSQ